MHLTLLLRHPRSGLLASQLWWNTAASSSTLIDFSPCVSLLVNARQDVPKLTDAIDDVGAQLWSVAEDSHEMTEKLIHAFQNDGWARGHAKQTVRSIHHSCCIR